MKRVLLAVAIVVLGCSVASAGWGYAHPVAVPVAPPVVVHSYYPVGPVYAYRPPAVAVPVVPAPVRVAVPAPVVYGYRYRPVVVRPKVYVWGQPVRNVLRAVTP